MSKFEAYARWIPRNIDMVADLFDVFSAGLVADDHWVLQEEESEDEDPEAIEGTQYVLNDSLKFS